MERMQSIVRIIKKYSLGTTNRVYYAPNIPDSVKQNITKNVDNNILLDTLAASFDTTLFGKSCKNGLFFTIAGLYVVEFSEKPIYINYRDIESIVCIADKKGNKNSGDANLEIRLKDNSYVVSNYSIPNKAVLGEMLWELIEYNQTWDSTPFEVKSGIIKGSSIDTETKKKCKRIIHIASAACGSAGSGLAQIPFSDTAVITPIQIGMINSLAAVFGLKVTKEFANSLLESFAASFAGRAFSQTLIGWIPGIGNFSNAATAAGITELIGWSAVKRFFKEEQHNRAKYSLEGQKKGYIYASAEYENKLRTQAELFETQQKDIRKEIEDYRELTSDYETYIEKLESYKDLSDGDKRALEEVKADYQKLKNLQ